MIDAHAHLDDPKFGDQTEAVLQRAAAAGVEAIILAGVDLDSSRTLLALADQLGGPEPGRRGRGAALVPGRETLLEACPEPGRRSGAAASVPGGGLPPEALEGGEERRPELYVAAGFHPHEASKLGSQELEELRALAAHPRVVAIGEIGLDYYREHSPREVQHEAFVRQLTLAGELGLPVVVHNRDAGADVYGILAEFAAWARGLPQLGMLHCFSEDLDAAERFIELGFHISIAGPVTYPNGKRTQEVAASVPLDRLLTETDAPYLPPQPHRGQRNEPAHVSFVVSKIAELRGLDEADVAAQTTANARRLFGLGELPSPLMGEGRERVIR